MTRTTGVPRARPRQRVAAATPAAVRAAAGSWALAALFGACAEPAPAPGGPNVVLIVLDTVRADALSCYGAPPGSTPAIDALAAQGTLFTRAFATDFWTLPSHATLLTGLYPREAGATSETNRLPESARSIAEELAAAGWTTAGMVTNPWLTAERGFAQGFGTWIEAWRDDVRPSPLATEPQLEGEGVSRASAWIERASLGETPFFLLVNLNVAHLPYAPPPRWRAGRLDETPDVLARLERLMRISGMWEHYAGELVLDAEDFRILRALYQAEVAIADDLVRRLLETLERTGAAEDTLVIVTSDHGENIGEHGLIDHVLSMHDTTLHVPLIARWPGRLGAWGPRREDLVSLVDVAATIRHAAGLPGDDGTRCLFEHGERRPAVFAENERPVHAVELLRAKYPHVDVEAIDRPQRVVRTGADKLVVHEGSREEWFDLSSDPREERPRTPEVGGRGDALRALLASWESALRVADVESVSDVGADDESTRILRELGYVR